MFVDLSTTPPLECAIVVDKLDRFLAIFLCCSRAELWISNQDLLKKDETKDCASSAALGLFNKMMFSYVKKQKKTQM